MKKPMTPETVKAAVGPALGLTKPKDLDPRAAEIVDRLNADLNAELRRQGLA
jgi:hypothetical protein